MITLKNDSRSSCYQFTHAFEDIEVKQNAPVLLEAALRSKRKKCVTGTGSMSDPYMHCEEHGMLWKWEDCFRYLQEFPEKYQQMSLFQE